MQGYVAGVAPATPERSVQQRRDALKMANVKRVHRSRVKADLRAGRIGVFDALDDPLCDTMKVLDVLRAVPGLGAVKAAQTLKRADISPTKTCAGITLAQRTRLAGELGRRPAVVLLRG